MYKLNVANAVCFAIVKHVLENSDNFWQVNNSSFTHFKKQKIKYFSPDGIITKTNNILCSTITAALFTRNFFYIKTILTNSVAKNPTLSALLVFVC